MLLVFRVIIRDKAHDASDISDKFVFWGPSDRQGKPGAICSMERTDKSQHLEETRSASHLILGCILVT